MSFAVAPTFLASTMPESISVTFAPIRCAPRIWSVFASMMSFTKPSFSPAVVAFPLAVKGNFPTLYSMPCSLTFFYVRPTDAISGEV